MITEIRDILSIGAIVVSLGSLVWTWMTRPGTNALSKVEGLEDRVASVEGELKHLPDKNTAHRMEMAIARLEGRLETMDERLKPVAAMASRMQDYLIESAK